jgi:hypothetical protein
MKSFGLIVFLIVALGASFAYSHWNSESNCGSAEISTTWSLDRAYEASLVLRGCNSGESLSYSARVDAKRRG